MNPTLEKDWHLSRAKTEATLTDFEFQLWRVFYGFVRWQEGCETIANKTDLTGSELSILHIIRMYDRAKTPNELMRLLNRNDNFNVAYSIKKLIKGGLIQKIHSNKCNKRAFSYEITEEGIKNTDRYASLRRNILIGLFTKRRELNLDRLSGMLLELVSIYEEADRVVLSQAGRGDHGVVTENEA